MQGQLHILISQFNLKLSNKNFHISSKTVARLLMNQAPRPQTENRLKSKYLINKIL